MVLSDQLCMTAQQVGWNICPKACTLISSPAPRPPNCPWPNSEQHKVCVYDFVTQTSRVFFMLHRVKHFADGVQWIIVVTDVMGDACSLFPLWLFKHIVSQNSNCLLLQRFTWLGSVHILVLILKFLPFSSVLYLSILGQLFRQILLWRSIHSRDPLYTAVWAPR